jgi:hypothetical protein
VTNTNERIAALLYGNGRAQMAHQETVVDPNEDIVMIPVISTNEDIVTPPATNTNEGMVTLTYENGRAQRPQLRKLQRVYWNFPGERLCPSIPMQQRNYTLIRISCGPCCDSQVGKGKITKR